MIAVITAEKPSSLATGFRIGSNSVMIDSLASMKGIGTARDFP